MGQALPIGPAVWRKRSKEGEAALQYDGRVVLLDAQKPSDVQGMNGAVPDQGGRNPRAIVCQKFPSWCGGSSASDQRNCPNGAGERARGSTNTPPRIGAPSGLGPRCDCRGAGFPEVRRDAVIQRCDMFCGLGEIVPAPPVECGLLRLQRGDDVRAVGYSPSGSTSASRWPS